MQNYFVPVIAMEKITIGEVYCGNIKIGDGEKREISIIAKDQLPHITGVKSFRSDGNTCYRTILFQGDSIQIDDKIFSGQSNELVNYSINGDTI